MSQNYNNLNTVGAGTMQAGIFFETQPPEELSTYECRLTIGHFHILKWTISVEVDFSRKSWLEVQCIFCTAGQPIMHGLKFTISVGG